MQVKSLKPQLDYLYLKETEGYLFNPSQKMDSSLIAEYLGNYLVAAETTRKLLAKERKKYSDEEFLYYLTRTASIQLSEQNVIYLLNKTFNQKYKNFTTILTTMTTKYINSNGVQEYIIGYNALVGENTLSHDKVYSKTELKKLLEKHQILIYNVFEGEFFGDEFEHEDYEEMPMIDLENILNNETVIRQNALKYIRTHISQKQIEQVIHDYLLNLQQITKQIVSQRDKFKYEQEFSLKCKREFKKNGQMQKLERLLTNSVK